jgi:Holliday junction resolvasome RuvABC ATP-dependent DNA helicase subunit|tara:strand:- start:94 stop:1020 length:927 start_codon:yes stop_codon:yes gene_type:complete
MPFEKLVGQKQIKSKLNFYIDVHKKTGVVPFLNFIGARGLGKTAYAREFANNLKNKNGMEKKFIEINSSTIKSVTQFLEQVFVPHIQDKEVTVLFDECHALPDSLVYTLLTILNTEKSPQRSYTAGDETYEFDFSKHHFLFATTESHDLFPPLKDRLTVVEFSDYSVDDLKGIIKSYLSEYTFCEDALQVIAETSRGNARSCILMAQDIRNYCKTYRIKHVSKNDAMQLFTILGVLPEGLNRIEWQILNILKKHGSCSLASLAAKTGLSRSSIQRDHEMFLLRKGFITIEGLRKITYHGVKVIDKKFN